MQKIRFLKFNQHLLDKALIESWSVESLITQAMVNKHSLNHKTFFHGLVSKTYIRIVTYSFLQFKPVFVVIRNPSEAFFSCCLLPPYCGTIKRSLISTMFSFKNHFRWLTFFICYYALIVVSKQSDPYICLSLNVGYAFLGV